MKEISLQVHIMIFLDSILFLLNKLLSLRQIIHAHTLHMLVFTRLPQAQVEVYLRVPILTTTGTVQGFQMKFQPLLLFQVWMSIILMGGGSTILLLSKQVAAGLVVLNSSLQYPLFLIELLEQQTPICRDLDLLSTHFLSATAQLDLGLRLAHP